MATTRIIPMHIGKGRTIAQMLTDATDSGKNPEKTNQGELISSYACDPRTADAEFLLAKREYAQITGRDPKNDVIMYQVRQSFKPGEVTPEDANKIGYECASRFLKGKHAFIVCTHTDKKHIHTSSETFEVHGGLFPNSAILSVLPISFLSLNTRSAIHAVIMENGSAAERELPIESLHALPLTKRYPNTHTHSMPFLNCSVSPAIPSRWVSISPSAKKGRKICVWIL